MRDLYHNNNNENTPPSLKEIFAGLSAKFKKLIIEFNFSILIPDVD